MGSRAGTPRGMPEGFTCDPPARCRAPDGRCIRARLRSPGTRDDHFSSRSRRSVPQQQRERGSPSPVPRVGEFDESDRRGWWGGVRSRVQAGTSRGRWQFVAGSRSTAMPRGSMSFAACEGYGAPLVFAGECWPVRSIGEGGGGTELEHGHRLACETTPHRGVRHRPRCPSPSWLFRRFRVFRGGRFHDGDVGDLPPSPLSFAPPPARMAFTKQRHTLDGTRSWVKVSKRCSFPCLPCGGSLVDFLRRG